MWLRNLYKPDWVDSQLAVLDKRVGRSAQTTSNPSVHHNATAPTVPECYGYGRGQAVIEQLFENGQLRAVDALTILAEPQSRVSSLLYRVIRRCGAEKIWCWGGDLMISLSRLGADLLHFWEPISCGCMHAKAGYRKQCRCSQFARVATPSVHMWFSIISAQTAHGKLSEAIQLYHKMRRSRLEPNGYIFVAALQVCAQHNSFVCTCLVDTCMQNVGN